MKFANLYYKRIGRLTIGDDIQFLAIKNLYDYMGINYNEVVRIGYHELYSYNGEYVILPISFPFYGYQHDAFVTTFSYKIIPVFLGLSIMSSNLSSKDIEYLRQYSPIGCRDEHTLNILRQNNIISYLNGCLTAAFPKRKNNIKNNDKIFCIDVPEYFKKYIPTDLLEQCNFVSHMYYYSELEESPEQEAYKVYEKYINEAKLIITTRLHGALPCVAAGIPVILLKDKLSFRFTGIDKIIKAYTKEEYEKIDWNPCPIEYEEFKMELLNSAANRLWDAFKKYESIYKISSFYESREKKQYYIEFVDNTIEFINKNWNKTERIEYALWGVTQTADMIYSYITKNYPKARLVAVIDTSKRLEFCGIKTCNCDWIIEHPDTFVFVCTGAAIKDSYGLFAEYKIHNFYQCCEDGNKHNLEKKYRNSFENVNL